MSLNVLSSSTVLGLRRAVLKAVIAHLPEGELTQTELAATLGMTRARLYALKQGRVEQFSLDALVALALRLNLKVRMTITRPYESAE